MSAGDNSESKHTKIFVGGVSIHTTDDGFKKVFERFGEITDSIILRDPESNRSRGFGFVTFKMPSHVERVLNDRPITIDDREVEVKRAIPKEANNPQAHSKTNKVFIGGLPGDISEAELKGFFEYYGVITEVELIYKEGVFRGFGFITFKEYDSVDKVIVEGSFDLRDNGHKCRVSKAGQRTPRQVSAQNPNHYAGPTSGHYSGGSGGGHYGGAGYYGAPGGSMQSTPGFYGGGGGGGGGGADSYYNSDYNGAYPPSKGSFSYAGGPSHGPPSGGGGHDSRGYGQGQSGYSGGPTYGGGEYSYSYGHGSGGPSYNEGSQYPQYKSEGSRGAGGRGRPRYKPY